MFEQKNTAITVPNVDLTQFNAFTAEVKELADKCNNFIIATDAELPLAENLAKTATSIQKTIENRREELKKPILEAGRNLDTFAKSIYAPLVEPVKTLKDRIVKFKVEAEAERQRAIAEELKKKAEAEAEAQRIADELRAKAESGNTVTVAEMDTFRSAKAAIAESNVTIATASQAKPTTGLRDNWKYKVINLGRVDRFYLTIDDAKVKDAIKSGAREIPGLEIYNDPFLSGR